MMVIPSSIVDSMGPSGVMAMTALAKQQQAEAADAPPQLPPGHDEDFG
jgi:hypothetical protein